MNLSYYLRMLRIENWIKSYFWIPLIGVILVTHSLISFFLVGIISFCITGYAYVINNYFDVEIDKKHQIKIKKKKNPLAQGFVTKKGVLVLLGFLVLIPLIIAIQMNLTGFVFVALSIIFSTLYSMKYIRLKERPVIDLAIHGFMFGLFPFLSGLTLVKGSLTVSFLILGALLTILISGMLLAHQIVDYDHDLGNTKTTAIMIGKKKSYICLSLILFSFSSGFILMLKYFEIKWWF